jgi:CheY-like chemotaxis protein
VVSLSVTDSGRGIEPEFLPYVFERFRQADSSTTRKYGGLGLGLAIVRHIVELHGGQVSAESEGRGKGATIRVVLPVRAVTPPPEADVPEPSRADSDRPLPRGDITGHRILVVDDEPDARMLLEAVLIGAGAVVETRPSVAEALQAVDEFRPNLVVCDIGMPERDGYDFIRHVRDRSRGAGALLPVVALTAYARPTDRRRAADAGFNAHVPKPVDGDELIAVIANVCAITAG